MSRTEYYVQMNYGSAKPSIFYGAWVDVTAANAIPRVTGKFLKGPGGGFVTLDT